MPPGIAVKETSRAARVGGDGAADRGAPFRRIGRIELTARAAPRTADLCSSTPAPHTAKPVSISISFSRSSDITQPPCGTRPPVTPVPAPGNRHGRGSDGRLAQHLRDLGFVFGNQNALRGPGVSGRVGQIRRIGLRLHASCNFHCARLRLFRPADWCRTSTPFTMKSRLPRCWSRGRQCAPACARSGCNRARAQYTPGPASWPPASVC